MKSTIERESPTRVNLTIEVPFAELETQIAEAYQRISKKVNIPGFRKGKTPRQLIDQHVGRETVLEEAINAALPQIYANALDENKLHAISRPNLNVTDLVDGQKVVVAATIDVRPDFETPEFTTLSATVDDLPINDEDVDRQLEQLRNRFASLSPVDRASKSGDVLTLDIAATVDGVPADEFSAKALTYQLGTDGLVPGADEALTGATVGSQNILKFTAEQGPNAGKEIELATEVIGVKERILPAADDDFAALASEFDTYGELRDDVRKRLEFVARIQQRQQGRALVLADLLTKVEIPVPDDILAAEVERVIQRDPEREAQRDEITKEVRNTLVSNMILDKVAEQIGVAVTDTDVAAWLVNQAPRFGVSPEQLAKALSESGEVRVAYSDIRRGKALDHIAALATVVDKSGAKIDMNEEELPKPVAAKSADSEQTADLPAKG